MGNGRVYFDDPNNDINILPNDRNWVRKGKRSFYLLTPDEFGKN
jgi:intergrase/recombinase